MEFFLHTISVIYDTYRTCISMDPKQKLSVNLINEVRSSNFQSYRFFLTSTGYQCLYPNMNFKKSGVIELLRPLSTPSFSRRIIRENNDFSKNLGIKVGAKSYCTLSVFRTINIFCKYLLQF